MKLEKLIKKELSCKRCGKCCYAWNTEKKLIKCKFLIILPNKKTLCRIYPNRIGHIVATAKQTGTLDIGCGLRENSEYDYFGCPYNTNKKILF